LECGSTRTSSSSCLRRAPTIKNGSEGGLEKYIWLASTEVGSSRFRSERRQSLCKSQTLPRKFGITTNLRLAHFLAQCALESTGFTAKVENLNYRAARLMKHSQNTSAVWNRPRTPITPPRLPTEYMQTGWVWRRSVRGWIQIPRQGYIQLTGKNNYTSFSTFVGEDCVANPDLVASKYPPRPHSISSPITFGTSVSVQTTLG
jgi:predicted chitinase